MLETLLDHVRGELVSRKLDQRRLDLCRFVSLVKKKGLRDWKPTSLADFVKSERPRAFWRDGEMERPARFERSFVDVSLSTSVDLFGFLFRVSSRRALYTVLWDQTGT